VRARPEKEEGKGKEEGNNNDKDVSERETRQPRVSPCTHDLTALAIHQSLTM
jgi:hypothetical protein